MTAPEFTTARMVEECRDLALHWDQVARDTPHIIPRLDCAIRARLYRAIAARLSDPPPWQPPPEAERPYRMRALALVRGEWIPVRWTDYSAASVCWREDDGGSTHGDPVGDVPMIPWPKAPK